MMMLVFLSIKPEELGATNLDLIEIRLAELLRAHRKGIHCIVMKRPTADWLLQNTNMPKRDEALLRRIAQGITQTGNLVNRACHIIEIFSCSRDLYRLNNKVVRLGLEYPYFDEIMSRPAFIVENINADINLFDFAFRTIGRQIIPGNFVYEPHHGGGENLFDVTKRQIDKKTIVVALCDSDKIAPCALDNKTQKFLHLNAEHSWPLLYYWQTPCRELENFIPISVAAELQSCSNSSTFQLLLKNDTNEKSDTSISPTDRFWLWYDLKDGFDSTKLSQIRHQASRAWVEAKLRNLKIDVLNFRLDGFGDKFVSQCLSFDRLGPQLQREMKSAAWMQVFRELLENILWVFFAAPEMRT